jgi:hypothetical protein
VSITEAKYDVKKEFPELYAPRANGIAKVLVPELQYIAVDGEGSPDGQSFSSGMQALYSLAYALKFRSKTEHNRDFVVAPAECLWSADDPLAFVTGDTGSWRWTLLSALPPWITAPDFEAAKETAKKKASSSPDNAITVLTSLARSQLLSVAEGLCLQVLHIGPYEAEAEVLTVMHNDVMPREGMTYNGRHHEIYLSNPGRTAPNKLKTILRQPVRPA